MTRSVVTSCMSMPLNWIERRRPVAQGARRSVMWGLGVLVCAAGLVAACDDVQSTVAPTGMATLTGTWDAQFSGTVEGQKAPQSDRFHVRIASELGAPSLSRVLRR